MLETINKITGIKKDSSLLIDDDIVSKINELIKQKDELKIIHLLKTLKKSAKLKYKNAQTIKEKIDIIKNVFSNLEKILNNTNYKKMYNSDASIGKDAKDYLAIEKISDMVSIGKNRNYNGANCHSWTLYIHNLLKDITFDDNEIKYQFSLDKNTNHSLLYLILKNKIFLYHYDEKKHIFKEKPNTVKVDNYKNYNNEKKYSKEKDKGSYLNNTITYNIGKKYFKVHKKFGFILSFEVKTDENDYKKINLPGFKYISKKIYRLYKYTKFLGFASKSNNIFDIKEKIYSKLKNEEEKVLAKNFFYNIDYDKFRNLVKK